MADVYADGRSILHAGDGLTQVSGPPDVCKTPSPGGPVPIPYPNAALDKHLAKGSKRVKIKGNPVALASSNLSTSTGDEPGTAGGGLISAKTKGKLTFGSSSIDVKFEGKGVVRFGDVTQHNGNSYNTVLVAAGKIGVAYGDDTIDVDDCPICDEPKDKHKIVPTDDIAQKARDLRKRLQGGTFAKVFVKPSGNPLRKGVMIGVLSCQCPTRKQYAGLGGPEYFDGAHLAGANAFREEAIALGLIPVVDAPGPPPATGFSPPTEPKASFGRISEGQWKTTMGRAKDVWEKHGRSNPPLTCAAPKMIQKCLADGHKPGTMIEIWVGLKKNSSVKVSPLRGFVLDESVDPPGIKEQELQDTSFGDGDPVPSCTTCQVVCSGMLCNTGKPPCP